MKNIFSKTPNSTTYIIGFGLSLLLTIIAFGLTQHHIASGHESLSHQLLIPALMGLALLQLLVQLVFFLHLVHEESPRWNFIFFASTFAVVLMIVVASIWIMSHLNYNMMPESMTDFILQDEGIETESHSHMNNMPQNMQDGNH